MNENYLIVLITLLFSFYFSGTEIAFISSNKLKIAIDNKQGKLYAKFFMKMLDQPSLFISTLLVGNNIALVVYGIAISHILSPILLEYLPAFLKNNMLLLLIQTILSTTIVLIFAEFIPKMLFRMNPNKMLILVSIPSVSFYYLLFPIVKVLDIFCNFIITKIFRIKINKKTKPEFNENDLKYYINEVASKVSNENPDYRKKIQIFQNAIEFPKIKVRECMIPRTEIVAVEISEPISELKQKFIETELSRILIYRQTIDNIIGYVHSHTIFHNPPNIESAIIQIPIVPESMLINKLLKTFILHKKSIALVVDEFGGTAGIVTLEDILEEIFGEINDEHDVEDLVEKKLSDNEYLFSGRLEIDYLNEKYNLDIPVSDEYETLAGFIINNHENIPTVNEEIQIGKFLFTITNVSQKQILMVKLKVLDN